ncbi:hypothetical protein KC727_00755 [Candidatus Kaiserbacteria bacterium]|nr:hypothetical protein [Candidatus Kaiserbacteria bacterium]
MDTRDKGGVRALGTFFVLLVVALGVTFQVPEEGHGAVYLGALASWILIMGLEIFLGERVATEGGGDSENNMDWLPPAVRNPR